MSNQVANQDIIASVEVDASSISGTRSGVAFGGETTATREARIRQFFASNKTIYSLGNLLSIQASGKTLADHLFDGRTVGIPKVKLADGTVIAPKNVQYMNLTDESVSQWGCIACGSAHGTGVAPSPRPAVKSLLTNKFFYAVESQTLFVVSTDCFGQYVKATGLKAQIKDSSTAKPVQPVAQKVEGKK